MAKIIPKLNLNRTPQAVENNSLVFAKDILVNKDNTFSRDKIMVSIPNDNTILNLVGTIPSNNSFYAFYSNTEYTESAIFKYDEETKLYTAINCAWTYSGGEIDGKVINTLNGDELLVIAEYKDDINIPIKTININTCTINDDESIYTQAPKVPIVNLFDKGTYSCTIPKGVYQFFIRFEIAKDYYTGWQLCSRELMASNSVTKNIVQGTIRYTDENADAIESFILEPSLVTDNGISYNRFQLGFIISTKDAVQCRTWKHFDISYITNKTPIYFSYDKTDIEEYNIDDMLKTIYNLYNVKNITTFKNKLYIANYKETDFNPEGLYDGEANFDYSYDEVTNWEVSEGPTTTSYTSTSSERPQNTDIIDGNSRVTTIYAVTEPGIPKYVEKSNYFNNCYSAIEDANDIKIDVSDFVKMFLQSDDRLLDTSYVKDWACSNPGFGNKSSFIIAGSYNSEKSLYSVVTSNIQKLINTVDVAIGIYDSDNETYSDIIISSTETFSSSLPTISGGECQLTNEDKQNIYAYFMQYVFGNNFGQGDSYLRGKFDITTDGKIVAKSDGTSQFAYIKVYIWTNDGSGSGMTYSSLCVNIDFEDPRPSVYSIINVTPAKIIAGTPYLYNGTYAVTISKTVTEYTRTIVTDTRTLMPETKYSFYIHYITPNGEVTNGYKIGTKKTAYFLKDSNHCYPLFTNINVPDGYTAAFISYAKTGNKFVDCKLSKQRINNTEDETTEILGDIVHKYKYVNGVKKYVSSFVLLDCPELDVSLYSKYDNIKVHYEFVCDGVTYNGIADGKYYLSSSYDSSQPYLFGATGKIGVEIEFDDIADDSDLSTELTDAYFYINDEFEITDDKISLKKYSQYFAKDNIAFDYNQFNSPGFICSLYKPNNKEFLYYFSGTDIYTKSSDGDLSQYKGRYEITTSEPIEIVSEYNLSNVALSTNLITDITRGYYNLKDGAYSATVTSIDNTPEYYAGINDGMEDLESLEDTWFYNHWVIIPAITATSSMIGMDILCDANGNISEDAPCCRYVGNGYSEIYDVGGTKELFDDAETNIDIISHLSHEAFLGNVAPTESVQHSTVTIDGQEQAIYKVTLYSKFQLSGAASSTTMVDTIYYRKLVGQDLDKEVTRVFRYIETTCAKTHDLKSYEQAENTKTTTYDGKFVITTTSKKTKKFSWNTDRVFIDANNKSIIPAPGSSNRCVCGYYYADHTNVYVANKADVYCPTAHTLSNSSGIDDYTYSYGLGILPILSSNVEVTSSSTSDVDENNAEYTAYQNYSYVESLNLSTIYKLPSMYYNYTTKLYLPYNASDNITEFNNTIRSSNVFSDESRTYGFEFETDRYYNVPCSKGIIVNLVTLGNYILVHTKDSLFNFNGSNSLQTENGQAQLKESDVFDTGIREVEGSEYGYCGMQKKNHACATQAGYIFYDASVNKFYAYSGQSQIISISDSFDKFLKAFAPTDVSIANDYYNDRVIICVKNDDCYETLSYNYRLKSLVSLHSYAFDKSFNTKTNVYCRLSEVANSGIFKLTDKASNLTPQLVSQSHFFAIMNDAEYDGKHVVDIIYNDSYEYIKTLNAISWIDDILLSGFGKNSYNFAEESVMRTARSAEINNGRPTSIMIYSDNCKTDVIDTTSNIQNNDEYNDEESYKHPRYNNGIWTLNYLRNIKQGNNEPSLIYGKYFVARFVHGANFKFENIIFNISRQ